ncbi:MAG TPA: carboxypeptidase-like regulatory domain-containing protein, partial [Pyrinomonadaceae bacterium]|nr:carboxypeptidase-like regulatory domain-containing protein [Pyrinomonadaceae bacterium]
MNWIHCLNARRGAALSLSLLLGQILNLGSICLAKPIPGQLKPGSIQSMQISVAILSFQDESGTGASAEFCQSLGEHLTKRFYGVPGRTFSPKSVRTKAGMEWSHERLSEFGKKLGVQFVVHPGLVAVSSDIAAGKITTSRARVYADIFSVEAATIKRVEAEGVGVQKGTDSNTAIQLGSADFGSKEFHYTSVGQALSKAIDQLAALINQEIGSGDSPPDKRPLPDDPSPYKPPQDSPDTPIEGGEDDPGTSGEAQEAQADEELQQLIAQAQECLNGLNATKDVEKINALIEALRGLTSALEAKANLLEQGKVTETDQTDQEIDAKEQELQDAVDQSLPQDQPEDLGPSEGVSSSGESKFDRVVKYVEFGFSVLEKIFDLRARFRGITQDFDAPRQPSGDPGAWDTPSEESFEEVNGNVFEDDFTEQASSTVEDQDLAVEVGENASGPNIADSQVNYLLSSSNAGVATTVAGRRRPVAGAEVIEPDSGASTRTDNSGFFALRVPARSTKLIVKKGGARVAEVAIHLVRGRPTVADIQLSRSGRTAAVQGTRVLPSSVVVNREGRNTGSIKGVIQDAKGQPVPRALVEVRGLAMARTDSKGGFSFTKVPAGLQQLTARASDSESRSEQVRVKLNETVESRIQLSVASRIPKLGDRLITPGAGSVLRGTVIDNQNRPVPGARISALSTIGSGGAVSVHTRTDGSFELRDLKPGSYKVLVDKVGLTAASQSVSLRGG